MTEETDEKKEEMPELATNPEWRGIMARARKDHKLTQDDLATKVGTSQVMISKIEGGQTSSSTFIMRICRVLTIEPPEHFESEEQRSWAQLGRVLRARNPEQYQLAKAVAESMAKAAEEAKTKAEEGEPATPSPKDRAK